MEWNGTRMEWNGARMEWRVCYEFLVQYLNLHEVDGLQNARGSCQHAGVENPASCGDDLSSSSVNGIGMESDVVYVEPHSSHIFLTQYPLERGEGGGGERIIK